MKAVFITVLIFVLGGCAGAPPAEISLNSKEFNHSNAGLVLGRTLAHEGDSWIGWRGLKLWFLNVNTNQIFTTGTGPMGYTSSEYFSIWLPEGSYVLTAIFAYNGALAPINEPLEFKVLREQNIYIGTITNSIEAPAGVGKLGALVAAKKYGRIRCFECTTGQKDIRGEEPVSDVIVLDEGKNFTEEIQRAIKNFPKDLPIGSVLLH